MVIPTAYRWARDRNRCEWFSWHSAGQSGHQWPGVITSSKASRHRPLAHCLGCARSIRRIARRPPSTTASVPPPSRVGDSARNPTIQGGHENRSPTTPPTTPVTIRTGGRCPAALGIWRLQGTMRASATGMDGGPVTGMTVGFPRFPGDLSIWERRPRLGGPLGGDSARARQPRTRRVRVREVRLGYGGGCTSHRYSGTAPPVPRLS